MNESLKAKKLVKWEKTSFFSFQKLEIWTDFLKNKQKLGDAY